MEGEPTFVEERRVLLDEEKECRNCHSTGGDDLIAPCACSGSIRYVHRSCLNSWRAVSHNPSSFTNCDLCGFKYVFNERPDLQASRVRRFALYVARDFLGAMLIVQCIIVSLAAIAWAVDHPGNNYFRNVFPSSWHTLAVYYVWGLFFFSTLGAVYGFILAIYWCFGGSASKRNTDVTYNSYPYFWGYYYIWCWDPAPGGYIGCCPACDCSHPCYCGHCGHGGCGCSAPSCDCGNSSSNNDGLGYAAMVVLAVGIVIGFIVMVVIAAFIIRTHMRVLRKYQDAKEMEVADLDKESHFLGGNSCAEMV